MSRPLWVDAVRGPGKLIRTLLRYQPLSSSWLIRTRRAEPMWS